MGRAGWSGRDEENDEAAPDGPQQAAAPSEAATAAAVLWPELAPWPARKHSILEAAVFDSQGLAAGSIALCSSCGAVSQVGGHWGRSALASDCLRVRSSGHDRQLSWILRGDHPSRKGFRVDRPTVISEASRAWLAPKMGLEQQPALARSPAEGLRPTAPTGLARQRSRQQIRPTCQQIRLQ